MTNSSGTVLNTRELRIKDATDWPPFPIPSPLHYHLFTPGGEIIHGTLGLLAS